MSATMNFCPPRAVEVTEARRLRGLTDLLPRELVLRRVGTGCRSATRRGAFSDRFWSKVDKSSGDGCWPWIAAVSGGNSGRYGMFWDGERSVGAHRVAYELSRGPIPDGLVIDHTCANPTCVNPWHMEAVPQAENVRRGFARRRQSNA